MKIELLTIPAAVMLVSLVGYVNGDPIPCGKDSRNFCNPRVTEVYDGDTFYVDIPKLHAPFNKRLGIRVKGVDTPEMRGGTPESKIVARQAKLFTSLKVMDSRLKLLNCTKGKYFRLVCDVDVNGKNLADMLIEEGLGKPYTK
jgi:endonuclease YncB( thermonuclease family)